MHCIPRGLFRRRIDVDKALTNVRIFRDSTSNRRSYLNGFYLASKKRRKSVEKSTSKYRRRFDIESTSKCQLCPMGCRPYMSNVDTLIVIFYDSNIRLLVIFIIYFLPDTLLEHPSQI